jgi:hypothetical protein
MKNLRTKIDDSFVNPENQATLQLTTFLCFNETDDGMQEILSYST